VPLTPEFLEDQIKFAHTAPYDFKASMLHDLEAGRRLELDWLAGKVVTLGRELGVPAPANATVYRVLKLSRMGD
jgi:2-dehydropantoate 2-reductase